jgi:succinoglycan biosynthesis protein ExoO
MDTSTNLVGREARRRKLSFEQRATVITAAYNAAHCITKAVHSALSQTEQNIEVVIVDDGSTDGTREVISRLAETDSRVRPMFLSENRGAAHALNLATRAARGKWISLLDADDWYEPTRLERLIDAAEAHDVEMVADNQIFYDIQADSRVGLAFQNVGRSQQIGLTDFFEGTSPTASFDYGMLKPIFLASFIRSHRVIYREAIRHGYDYFVLLDFFVAGGRALIVDEPFYYYVQPYGSISRRFASAGGRRYPFEHVKEMNDNIVTEMRGRLSEQHLETLIKRGEAMACLARLHQVRESLGAGRLGSAFIMLVTAPFPFWELCGQRVLSHLSRLHKR